MRFLRLFDFNLFDALLFIVLALLLHHIGRIGYRDGRRSHFAAIRRVLWTLSDACSVRVDFNLACLHERHSHMERI